MHSTPLTNIEGCYLEKKVGCFGRLLNYTSQPVQNRQSVIDCVVSNRKQKSESIFELLLLTNRHNNFIPKLDSSSNKLFNQFILGIQRQVDILSIRDGFITIIEIKKKDNRSNPYEQLMEYKDYALSDFRLLDIGKGKDIKLIAILEDGNQYAFSSISDSYPDVVAFRFSMTKEYMLEIDNI